MDGEKGGGRDGGREGTYLHFVVDLVQAREELGLRSSEIHHHLGI